MPHRHAKVLLSLQALPSNSGVQGLLASLGLVGQPGRTSAVVRLASASQYQKYEPPLLGLISFLSAKRVL